MKHITEFEGFDVLLDIWNTFLILAFPIFGQVFKQVDLLNYVSLELILNWLTYTEPMCGRQKNGPAKKSVSSVLDLIKMLGYTAKENESN